MRRSQVAKVAGIASVAVALSFSMVGRAAAATAAFCSGTSPSFLSFPTWYKYLNPRFEGGECVIDVKFPEDIAKVVLAVVEILLRLGGLVAVGFVVYGGFRYITSQGEPENTKSARQTIQNAIIGVAIATIATVAVAFVGRSFS